MPLCRAFIASYLCALTYLCNVRTHIKTLFIYMFVRESVDRASMLEVCDGVYMISTSSNNVLRSPALRDSLFVEVLAILEHVLEAAQHPLERLAVDREAQGRRDGRHRRLATLVGQK